MKGLVFLSILLSAPLTFSQESCKGLLLSGDSASVASMSFAFSNESDTHTFTEGTQEFTQRAEENVESLRSELDEVASVVNQRRLNIKTEAFQQVSQNLASKLYELNQEIENTSNQSIKSYYNSLVLKAMSLLNTDDFQLGFRSSPVTLFSMPVHIALDLVVETEIEEQYSLLTLELYRLVSEEQAPEFQALLSQVQTREHFEAFASIMFSGQASQGLLLEALKIQNPYQLDALVYALQGGLNPTLMQAVLSVQNKYQLEVFQTALEQRVTENTLYFEVIPAITTDEQASNVMAMIKAGKFN